ncbi:MAG: MFS transporter [Pyrobaculum sp.]
MVISWFLFAISGSLTFPYMSKYLHLLGASDIEIGLVRALGSLAVMLTILPGGLLTDLVGRKRSIVVGTWGIAVVQFAYAIVQDWRQFALVYVVDWALHFYQPALTAILLDSLPQEKRGGGMMLTTVLPQIPWLFLPPVGGYLLDQFGIWGMRLSFLLSGVISVTVALLRMRALQETIVVKKEGDVARRLLSTYLFWRGLRELSPYMAYITTLGFIMSWASIAMQTFGVLYATTVIGIDNTSWGVIQSAATAVSIFFGLVLIPVIDKTPRVIALFSGLLLIATGYLMAGFWKNVVALVTAAIIVGIGAEATMAVRRALVGDYINPENRGRVLGAMLALEYLGSIAGGVITAVVYTHSPTAAFIYSGAMLLLAAAPLVRRLLNY